MKPIDFPIALAEEGEQDFKYLDEDEDLTSTTWSENLWDAWGLRRFVIVRSVLLAEDGVLNKSALF